MYISPLFFIMLAYLISISIVSIRELKLSDSDKAKIKKKWKISDFIKFGLIFGGIYLLCFRYSDIVFIETEGRDRIAFPFNWLIALYFLGSCAFELLHIYKLQLPKHYASMQSLSIGLGYTFWSWAVFLGYGVFLRI